MMGNGADYSPLGDVLDRLARRRNVRGPYSVRTYMERRMAELGYDPNDEEGERFVPRGQTVSKYFYGQARRIDPRFIPAFAEAFELTEEEREELAWVHAYGFPVAMNPRLAA